MLVHHKAHNIFSDDQELPAVSRLNSTKRLKLILYHSVCVMWKTECTWQLGI